jgi:hypothetical protein
MLRYFDILFVRTYRQYVKWKETDMPGLYAMMVVSLFQTLNILFLIILVIGVSKGRNWSIGKAEITLLALGVIAINSIRIYKVVGIKNILTKHENKLGLLIHPIIYFILSIGALVVLRIIGIFPHIV